MARRRAVALDWIVAQGMGLRAVKKFGSHAGELGPGDGMQYDIEQLNGQPAPL